VQQNTSISKQIHAFGGINFVMSRLKRMGVDALLDEELGKRPKQAKYSFADTFLAWMYCNLCGAKRMEDVYTENLHATFKQIPFTKLCSPDQLARIFKKFATPTQTKQGTDTTHEINLNPLLNHTLLKFCKALGLLDTEQKYLLDFDGTLVPAEKYDSRFTYKGFVGYAPAVMFIGKIPVSIEARNGNTGAAFALKDTLSTMFEMLDAHGIQTWGIRMDAASYQNDLIHWLDKKNKLFYIRQKNTEFNLREVSIGDWKQVDLHGRTEEITSVRLQPFPKGNMFRIVATRFKKEATREDIRIYQEYKRKKERIEQTDQELNDEEYIELLEELDAKTGKTVFKKYIYRSLVTNDYKTDDLEVVKIYDQRGDSENNFRDLLNDFNWKRVPFSFMNENLVFLYVSVMAKCLFLYVMQELSRRTSVLEERFKLKKFIAYFVKRVSVQWEQQGDDWVLKLLNLKEKFEDLQQWAILK
jgi:hypothetical protein